MRLLKKLFCFLYRQAAWPQAFVLVLVRIYLAKVFFLSGLTKISNWSTTIALFQDEYRVPVLSAECAAYLSTAGELIFPVLLILGLLTPMAALGLIAMTSVIELFVYPGTTEHYYWLLLSAVLLTYGGGKISVDYTLQKYWIRKNCLNRNSKY